MSRRSNKTFRITQLAFAVLFAVVAGVSLYFDYLALAIIFAVAALVPAVDAVIDWRKAGR